MKCPTCQRDMETMNDGAYCWNQDCTGETHLTSDDLDEIISAYQKACAGLLREVYVGDGKVVAPPAIVPHLRLILAATKLEPK